MTGTLTPPPPTSVGQQRAPRSRGEMLRAPLILGAVGISATVALHFRDPHQEGSWGVCPYLLVTGQPCPGCGGLRAVNDLTRGDWVAALSSNALAVVFVLTLGVSWAVWVVRRAGGHDVPLLKLGWRTAALAFVVVISFSVFRLTPWGEFLQP